MSHSLEKGNKAVLYIGRTKTKVRVEVIGKRGDYVLLRPLEETLYGIDNGTLSSDVAKAFDVDEKYLGCRYGNYHAITPEVSSEEYDWVPPTSVSR